MKSVVPKLQETIVYSTRRGRYSAGAFYCTKGPNFSKTTQAVLIHHIAEKHPRVRAKNTYKCEYCLEEFYGFYGLWKHKNSQHGLPKSTSNLDLDILLEDINDAELREELNSCNHFLVDSELEKRIYCVFDFATSSFDDSFLKENLDQVFNQLKRAAKVNLAFGFVLKTIENVTCTSFYAHKTNGVMESSKLVCTQDDMANPMRYLLHVLFKDW